MSYRIEYRGDVERDIERLARDVQRRVAAKILSLAINPRPPGCVKLSGQANLYRVRVGDYRIVYEIQDAKLVIIVITVAHRRDVYRGL